MTIKERAQNVVKAAYKKYGLKADELAKIAENIADGLAEETTDDDLNAAVKQAEFYASLMQSVGNRKQVEIEKKYEGWQSPKSNETTPPNSPTPPTPPVTEQPKPEILTKEEIAKMISDGIAAGLAPIAQRQEQERLKTLLNGADKLKDVPQSFRSRYTLDKEENLGTLTDQIANDYQTLRQEMFKSGTVVEAPRQSTPQQEEDAAIEMLKKINAQVNN